MCNHGDDPVDVFYILTPGFADDDDAELSNGLSPDQGKANQSDLIEDPELNEIAQKLKELEASSESEDEVITQEVTSEEIIPIEGGYVGIGLQFRLCQVPDFDWILR